MLHGYRRSLEWVLENPGLVLVILIMVVALNVVLVIKIPKGFFPQQDTGAIVGGIQGPQDASFPVMNDSIQQIVGVVKADPAVANVVGYVGTGNGGFIYIALKPLDQRKIGAPDIINRLRPKLNRLVAAVGVYAGGAGFAHWRQRQQRALSIHHPGGQRAGSVALGAHSSCGR